VVGTWGISSIATSPNGSVWTTRTLPEAGYWYAIAGSNGHFIAGNAAANHVATSNDCVSWTTRTVPSLGQWSSAAYGNGVFVMLAGYFNGGSKFSQAIVSIP
jgi:hypothetical protein